MAKDKDIAAVLRSGTSVEKKLAALADLFDPPKAEKEEKAKGGNGDGK